MEQVEFEGPADASARELLTVAEDVLAHWITARSLTATQGEVEGFRLLALHRQGARGDPSFNACRESCRELVYHYNLITLESGPRGHGPAAAHDADAGGAYLLFCHG